MRQMLMAVLLFPIAASGRAELQPDEVALIAMASSDTSRRLAEYYAEARGVPMSQIFLLAGKPGGEMGRAEWQTEARPAIRDWLRERELDTKIRCMVTCWDVPLRIGRRASDAPEVVARQRFLARARTNLVEQLAFLVKRLDSLAPGEQSPEQPPPDADADAAKWTARFESALQAAGTRLKALDSEEEKKQAAREFERVFASGGGLTGLLRAAAARGAPSPEMVQKVELLKGQLQGLGEGLQALGRLPDSASRDVQILAILRKTNGLIGELQWVDQQQQLLGKNETHAGFDSELSLLLWPDYSLFRWQRNVLRYWPSGVPTRPANTLMVSRLAAPTPDLARKLIDTAIATEKTGLSGKVYLDARGMKFNPQSDKRGSYGEYDQSLRDLAERLKKHTELQVVLNDEAALFQEGDCPEAALYCGWYSLAKYVDAFDWKPGAVGFHMASSEAASLLRPGARVWCSAMLEDGICATLGPTYEPYIAAFPLPDDFFSLLLTGRYTLAESYYRTKPFSSWAMVLVGDPLYNPFKTKPLLDEDALPQRLRGIKAATPQ